MLELTNAQFVLCRTLAVHFTDPFHISTRVIDKCNDGTLLLQVFVAVSDLSLL